MTENTWLDRNEYPFESRFFIQACSGISRLQLSGHSVMPESIYLNLYIRNACELFVMNFLKFADESIPNNSGRMHSTVSPD